MRLRSEKRSSILILYTYFEEENSLFQNTRKQSSATPNTKIIFQAFDLLKIKSIEFYIFVV